MLFVGAISYTEAKSADLVQIIESNGMTAAPVSDLVQVIEANGMTAVVESESDSESDSDDNADDLVSLGNPSDSGIVDATTAPKGQCTERLWESGEEMNWQMDQFSRKFDI